MHLQPSNPKWRLAPLIALLLLSPGPATAEGPTLLSEEAWRADLDQLVRAVRENHFQPFRRIPEDEFLEAVAELRDEIPRHGDIRMMLELAELVALLEDGHTRLALPRSEPELAMALHEGHGGTAPPEVDELRLAHLPVQFELFEDGLFVTRATERYRALLGVEVEAFGEVPVEDALEAVRPLAYADNEMTARWYAPDRLALPAVLEHVGLATDADRVRITVSGADGRRREVELRASSTEGSWIGAPRPDPLPVAEMKPEEKRWTRILPEEDALYIQIDELEAAPQELTADWLSATLRDGRSAGAERVILDLRENHGGSGSWNEAIVKTFVESPYDDYGRFFVLIGRRTFSAAHQLVEKLEIMTQAIFVGKPTGSRPGHFGDPAKIRLAHSGLTLRVSTLYWSGTFAGDFREAIAPHLPVPTASADQFQGRDPLLETALGWDAPRGISPQVEDLLRRGRTQEALIHFFRFLTDPSEDHDVARAMAAAGRRLLEEGLVSEGFRLFSVVRTYLPDSPEILTGLGRAFELRHEPESAREAYEGALELDPEDERARAGLERLSDQDRPR